MKHQPTYQIDRAARYKIQVEGGIHPAGADWLEGLTVNVSYNPPITTLTGRLTDQAALHGLLQTLYSLGLPLLNVERLD
jgi:hypothetical protein